MQRVEFVILDDGRIFPYYENEALSWAPCQYFTQEESEKDYPKMRTVIRAAAISRPEMLREHLISALKGTFDSVFGENAKRFHEVLKDEISQIGTIS